MGLFCFVQAGHHGRIALWGRCRRFFGLRPQNDKRRQCILCLVILSASEESFFCADPHSLHPSLRGRETPVAIRFPCIAHLLQICGFAGLYLVLSSVFETPLSLLVQRKLQRKHTKAGRRKSPRLAIHSSARRKLFLSTIRRRAGRRSACAPIEMYQAGKYGSVSDEMRGSRKRFFALRPQNDRRRKCTRGFVILSTAKNLSALSANDSL